MRNKKRRVRLPDYRAYTHRTDTEWDYDERCVICQNEGGHDVEDRPHVFEGQE